MCACPAAGAQRRGIRKHLHDRGIRVQDIPKALLVYEGLSLVFEVTALAAAYTCQPLKTLVVWTGCDIACLLDRT
jgi:hypothetical protein